MHGARGRSSSGFRPADDALSRDDYLRGLKENPDEVIEHPVLEGLDSEYSPEYLVEPEFIKEPEVTQK